MKIINNEPPIADCFGLPTYVVDTVVPRDIGGIASIINYRDVGGVLVPQCEVIVSPMRLVTICQGATEFALEMRRRQMAIQMTEMIGVARH